MGRLASQAGEALRDHRITLQGVCAEVRMYYAEHADGAQALVLVGVDIRGNDLDDGEIGDNLFPCPPFHSVGSIPESGVTEQSSRL